MTIFVSNDIFKLVMLSHRKLDGDDDGDDGQAQAIMPGVNRIAKNFSKQTVASFLVKMFVFSKDLRANKRFFC